MADIVERILRVVGLLRLADHLRSKSTAAKQKAWDRLWDANKDGWPS